MTIYVIYGGMDCDCVKYEDSTTCASQSDFEEWENELYEYAEGTVWARQVSKAEYDKFSPSSRDLALEAYEDGHPHIVYV